MNEGSSVREVLFGVEEYLRFSGNLSDVGLTRDIVKILDSDNIEEELLNYLLKTLTSKNPNDRTFKGINDYRKQNNDFKVIKDAWSRSQLKSKIWLAEELLKIKPHYDNGLIMAGWFGQLCLILDKKITYKKIRIVELDRAACETSDYNFNLSNLKNYRIKSVHADINNLVLHKNGYEWPVENFKEGTSYIEKFLPDLIINTSAEHMSEDWYHQIRFKGLVTDPIVAIQSNNMFDGTGHINCVYSVDHMKKKFPMREVLFEGEMQLKGYKRVMLIGKP